MMRTRELSVTQKISEGDRYSVGYTRLDEPVPGVGQESDAVASSDTGTFSLVGLFKRLLTKLPPLVNNTIPVSIKGADVIVNAEISNQVEIKNDIGNPVPVAPAVQQGGGAITATTQRVTLATDGPGVAALNSISGLSIPAHDHITLGYTGSNLTSVVYRTGGSGGTVVGTLTLAYSGSNLTSVTRS